MILKFLEGRLRGVSKDNPTDAPTAATKAVMGLVLSYKTDILQHFEMMRYVRMNVLSGGFVKRTVKAEETNFYGESISCSVRAKGGDEHYRKYLINDKIWHADVEHCRKKHALFITLPDGLQPWELNSDLKWKEVSYAEMLSILEGEENSRYY